MEAYNRGDLVCLYLDSVLPDEPADPAPGDIPPEAIDSLTATAIADALELEDSATARVDLLSTLESLAAENDLRRTDPPTDDASTRPGRPVYLPTETARERASDLRSAVADDRVVVTNGTREEVPLREIDGIFPEHPLVTALARRTDEGEVPLETHVGHEFVNRQDALETVTDSLQQSFRRESHTVLVTGEAGIGKTELVREACDRLATEVEDLTVVWGRSPEGIIQPYAAIEDAFRELPDGEALIDHLESAHEAVDPDSPTDIESQRQAMFADVAEELRSQSLDQSIVVVIDNLHWADPATLDLLGYLATEITELMYPIGFVAAYREPAVVADPDHPIRDFLERVERDGTLTKRRLDPLSRTDTRALVSDVVGRQRLPEAFVEAIYERTGGNPLFVRETATAILEAAQVDPDLPAFPTTDEQFTIPETVSAELDARLDLLGPAPMDLLAIGAAIGEEFPRDVLFAAAEQPADRAGEYVDVLVAGRIWEQLDADRLAFHGGAIRDAVLDRLSADQRRDAHRHVADAYEDCRADDLDRVAGRIASHAAAADQPARAIEWYRRAARVASDAYAPAEAIRAYEEAINLATDHDALADTALAELYAGLAQAAELASRYERARQAIDAGLAVAPEESELAAELLGTQAAIEASQGAYDESREAADRLQAVADTLADPSLQAEAHLRLGRIAVRRGAYDDAREHFEAGLAAAERADDRKLIARTTNGLGRIAWRQGNYDVATDQFERALTIHRDRGDERNQASALNNLGGVAGHRGDFDATRAYFEEALELFEAIDYRRGIGACLNNLGATVDRLGEYGTAQEYFERALEIREAIGDRQGVATTSNNLGEVLRKQGEYERSRDYYNRARATAAEIDNSRQVPISDMHLAELALDTDDPGEGIERAEAAIEALGDLNQRPNLAQAQLIGARCHLALDDHDRAMDLVREAAELAGDLDEKLTLGRSRRLRGRIALERGDTQTAAEALASAWVIFEELESTDDLLETGKHLLALPSEKRDMPGDEPLDATIAERFETAPPATRQRHEEWIRSRGLNDEDVDGE